jgi:hypothetical protein
VTPEEIAASYDAACARLGVSSPEPPPFRRLVDFLLAPFGLDSRSYARAERREVAEMLVEAGASPETARAEIDAVLARR